MLKLSTSKIGEGLVQWRGTVLLGKIGIDVKICLGFLDYARVLSIWHKQASGKERLYYKYKVIKNKILKHLLLESIIVKVDMV
jgi:hypothetical protein